jgi:hypothetical protein
MARRNSKETRTRIVAGGVEEVDDLEEALRQAEADVQSQVEGPPRDRSQKRHDKARKDRATKVREENEAKGITYIQTADGKWRRSCKGRNLYNEPCGCMPMKKGTVLTVPGYDETCIATGGFCIRCDDAVSPEFLKAWMARAAGGRKRRVGPDEYMRQIVMQGVGLFMRPHLQALGIEIDKNTGEPRRVPGGGAKVYGESKDGDIVMTTYDDVEAQQKAAERLFDRGFGRPRTQTELSLTPTGAGAQIPPSAERAREVALVLAEAGAVQTDDDTEEE